MPRVRRVTTPAPEPSPDSTVVICSGGDVLIKINDPTTGTEYCYRCSRNVLRGASEYFSVLLDPVKFSEGIAIEAALLDLKGQYYDTATIPASELPKAIVADVGDIPKSCVSTGIVVKLFFEILHDPSTTWPPVLRAQSVNLVALLAIVADRFACLKTIAEYLRRQGLETTLLKDRKSATAHQTELENRQKLFAGLLFGFQDWAYQCSVALIVEQRLDGSENEEHEGDDALWWNIPGGVEEELVCRRDYILQTLSSIQKHFINLYISRQPQCRLGYSSSPQCDSYQLGEMIRFFSRKGTLRIDSAFDPTPEELEPYNGNLNDIIAKLKECPSYQIDSNHTHCGLRNRLISVLDGPRPIRPSFQVGICLGCWKENKSEESWFENPTGGTWINAGQRFSGRGCGGHRDTKAMYTAVKRDWTPVCAV